MRIKIGWKAPVTTAPKPRDDYRVYDMGQMKAWGFSAFWMTPGEKACVYGPSPRVGDLLVSAQKKVYLILNIETQRDPGDQHFVTVRQYTQFVSLEGRHVQRRWF